MAAQATCESTGTGRDADNTGDASAGNASAFMRYEDYSRSSATSGRNSDGGIASPRLAQAWAQSILRFWQAGICAGSITPAKPLYLFDPAPGDGQLAWLMMRALQRHLAASGSKLAPCYVACDTDAARLDGLATHPYLAEYADDGWFDTALWPAGHGNAIDLRRQATSLLRTANPVVVLCLQWFGRLPSALYAIHHGKAMEGWVAPAARCEEHETCALDYDWRPLDGMALASSPHRAFLGYALARFTSAPLPLPTAACDAIDTFARLSAGRYLLLSTDAGCHAEQQLRLGMLAPLRDDDRSSVNYHALSLHQQQQRAWTWNHQLQDEGNVLHAAWRDDSIEIDDDTFSAIVAPLNESHPDDAAVLAATSARTTNAAGMLTLLRLSGYDPGVLENGMSALLALAGGLCPSAYRAWRTALSYTWANYLPPASDGRFYFDAGLLAAEIGHWALAKTCFRTGLALYGDDATDLHHLAYCEAATGGSADAMTMLAHALALDPEHTHCLALRKRLAERLLRWKSAGWYHPDVAIGNDLTIEPLGPEHAESLLYQYRDAQIGIMTRLPELNTLDDTTNWIEEQSRDAGRATYAVMHRHHGFVGIVSAHCAGDAGYFYFWIGTDFQDMGFGKQAAQLLCTQMIRNGIARLFTSVYVDNIRSRNALAQLGFLPINVRAQAPDDDLLFYQLPLQGEDRTAQHDLRKMIAALCDAIQSAIVFSADDFETDDGAARRTESDTAVGRDIV